MSVTASELRQNVYRLLDEVLETGRPLEIERKGRLLRIVPTAEEEPDRPVSRLDAVRGNPHALVGDPDDILHMDWSGYWTPDP